MLWLNNITLWGHGTIKRQAYTANLDVYSGTWEYVSNNEVFRITLKIGTKDTKDFYGSCLIGDYYYSKNEVVLDNYSDSKNPATYDESSRKTIIIYASNGKIRSDYVNPNKLYVFFNDKRLKKWAGSGVIQLISPTQIRWILKDDEGIYGNEEVISGFSVPSDVIMTKK